MKKRIVSLFLVCFLALGIQSANVLSAKTESEVKFSKSAELCNYLFQGYNQGKKGPIIITKGTFRKWLIKKDVYLVTLTGTEFVWNQTTGYMTDLLAGFNWKNAYLRNAVKTMKANIPVDSNVMIAGHSLGGMIAQQLAAEPSIKKNYHILHTVTFGSPLIAGEREGVVKRLGDTADKIPYQSIHFFYYTAQTVLGLNREDGGYGTDSERAHVESYCSSRIWEKYDVTGTKYGHASINLDLTTQHFFKSPIIDW